MNRVVVLLLYTLIVSSIISIVIGCPNWCNNRGYCTSPLEGGYCVCQSGYTGDDCSIKICPKAFEPLTLASKPNRRTIRIKTGSSNGYLNGGLIFSFGNGEAFLNANANITDDNSCTRSLMQMDTVTGVSCVRESIDDNNGGTYIISLDSFPMIPKENNLFFHSGNPHSSAFKCNTSMIGSDVRGPFCLIDDVILPDLPSYLECAGHGSCDKVTGQCLCEKGFKGLDCSDNTDSSDIYVNDHDGPFFSGSLLKLNVDRTQSPVFNILAAQISGSPVTTIRGDKLLTHTGNANIVGSLVLGEMSRNGTSANIYSTINSGKGTLHFRAISGNSDVFKVEESGAVYVKGKFEADRSSFRVSEGSTFISQAVINENLQVSGHSTLNGNVNIGGSLAIKSSATSNYTLVNLDISGTGSFLKASTNGRDLFDLSSEGLVTLQSMRLKSGGISIDAGGLLISSGGAVVNGGLTVKSGGLSIADQDLVVKTLELLSSDSNLAKPLIRASPQGKNYAGNILELKSNSSSKFNFFAAVGIEGDEKFTVSGDGSLQAAGGLTIGKDLLVSKHASLLGGLSISKKTVSAGNSIIVANDASYIVILDDGTTAANELVLPADIVSIGQVLVITNNDAQSTKGSFHIPPGATVLLLFDGKRWVDIEALRAPVEHLKNVKTLEVANDINIGNFTLTAGRLKATRMQKGSIPVVSAGGFLLDSDKFTFTKGTLNTPAIKAGAILSDIDVRGNTLSNAVITNAKISDSSISAKEINVNGREGLAFFSDKGQLQSTKAVSFDSNGNIIIASLSKDLDLSGFKITNGNLDNIKSVGAKSITADELKVASIGSFTLSGTADFNNNALSNVKITNGVIENVSTLKVQGSVTFPSLASQSQDRVLVASDSKGLLSTASIKIIDGKIDSSSIDFTNHKETKEKNLELESLSSKSLSVKDKADLKDVTCVSLKVEGTAIAQSASLTSAKISGNIEAQSASLESAKISGSIEAQLASITSVTTDNLEAQSASIKSAKITGNLEAQSASITSAKISGSLDVQKISISSLSKISSPISAQLLAADTDGSIHTIQLEDIPTKIQKNMKLESLQVEGKVQLDSLYFKKGNDVSGKKSLLQIGDDGEVSYVEKGNELEFEKVSISKELKVKDLKITSLDDRGDIVGLLHADRSGSIVSSNVIKLEGKDKDTVVSIKASKTSIVGGVDITGSVFIDDSLQVRGTVMGSGPYLDSSDKRLKKDIKPMTGSLDIVSKLQAVTYLNRVEEFPDYFPNTNNRRQQLGWIADEVEKVMPELVDEDPNGYKAVAYARSVSVIAEAVKELQQITNNQIASLQEQIKVMQEQLNSCKCS